MKVPLTIRDHIERAVLVYGDRVAAVDEPDQPAGSLGRVTYRRLHELAQAQAARLDQLGVPQGARVAIVSQNSARLLAGFYGVSAWGRVYVPINFRLARDEIAYIVEHCGATVLLVDPELVDVVEGHRRATTPSCWGSDDDQIYLEGVEPEPWEPDEDATATINYTSGTTARPKGVQMTHRNLWVNAATFGWHAGRQRPRRLPAHAADVPLQRLGHALRRHRHGRAPRRAAQGRRRRDPAAGRGRGRHPDVRCAGRGGDDPRGRGHAGTGPSPAPARTRIVVAGAPPPTRTIERVETELGWEFIQIYGLTETAPLLTINRGREEWDDLSATERAGLLARAGVPALGVTLKTDDEGEVLARSNVVLEGYWENPDATADALDGGWFHTGDGGYIDDGGYLTIADRKKDVIISGGENVSSIEVEDRIFSHPAVAEVAVIGVPDEKWGETVIALVVVADGSEVTEAELIEHTRGQLAHYKCPTRIEFRDELARTATGKLQKYKLRQPYWEGRDKQVN